MDNELQQRHDAGLEIVQSASITARDYFSDIDKLVIEQKVSKIWYLMLIKALNYR